MSKEEVIAIGKVEIIIKGEKHALTMAEAEKLKDALNNLFKVEVVTQHHDHYYPSRPWYQQLGYGGSLGGQTLCGKLQSTSNGDDLAKQLLDYKISVS